METKFEPLTKYLKSLLEKKLSDVKLAELPPKTSAVIIPGQNGMSPMQERMFVLQNNGKENDPIFKMYLNEKKIMQLNADHPIIKKLLEMVQNPTDKNKLDNLLKFFYDSCFVASGWEVRSTKGFQARSDKMFRDYLGIEQEQTFSTQGDISGAETAEKADTDKEENGHSEL